MNRSIAAAAVVVRRTIAASAEELFDAWLDPEALGLWMRPTGIGRTSATTDARVGGRFEIVMHGEGTTYPHRGLYRVIDRPRRLVFSWSSRATEGLDTLVTVDFLPHGRCTEVVVTHERLPEGAHASHAHGWSSAIERLAALRENEGSP